ncbi:MAG: TRAP transporter small permease [Alphaproteobacteria bacterium]|nr:TRAP transporter small permease [Alphaproteobacteria bacterium]
MQQTIHRVASSLTRAVEVIAGILVGIAVAVNLAQVVYRRLLGDPLEWSEEVMRYTMVWVAFLAGAAAVFRGEHMAAGILDGVGSRAVKLVLHYVILGAMGAFSLVLAWWGTIYGLNTGQVSPAAQIPMNYAYLAVGVGGILMSFKTLCLLLLPPNLDERSDELRPEDMV